MSLNFSLAVITDQRLELGKWNLVRRQTVRTAACCAHVEYAEAGGYQGYRRYTQYTQNCGLGNMFLNGIRNVKVTRITRDT